MQASPDEWGGATIGLRQKGTDTDAMMSQAMCRSASRYVPSETRYTVDKCRDRKPDRHQMVKEELMGSKDQGSQGPTTGNQGGQRNRVGTGR